MDNSTTVDSVFQERFSNLMKERGITQAEASEGIGVTRQAISLYATGKRTPDINSLYRISDYFKVSSDYLLGLSDVKSFDVEEKAISEKTGLSEYSIKKITDYKDNLKHASILYWHKLRKNGLNEILENTSTYFLIDRILQATCVWVKDCEIKEHVFKIYCTLNNLTYDSRELTIIDANGKKYDFHTFYDEYCFFYKHYLHMKEIDISYENYLIQKDFLKIIDRFQSDMYSEILSQEEVSEELEKIFEVIRHIKIKEKLDEYQAAKEKED